MELRIRKREVLKAELMFQVAAAGLLIPLLLNLPPFLVSA
jgi:hypothetical protein